MHSPKQQRMSRGSVMSITACALVASSAVLGSSRTAEPLAKLDIWQGSWKNVIRTMETPYSHASSVRSHSTCSWTPDHGYMLCEYARDSGDPKQLIEADHLSIFTYDDNAKSYKHLGVSKEYKTLEEMASIDGNLWHYRYQLPIGGGKMLDLRDSYEFVNTNQRITRIEVSSDAGRHWVLMSESVDTRSQ